MMRFFLLATGGILLVYAAACTSSAPTTASQSRKVYHANNAVTGSNIPAAFNEPTPAIADTDTLEPQAGQRAVVGNSPGLGGITR